MRRLGVHTSIAGGLDKSLLRASELGCDTLQIFSHNPRGWALKDISPGEAAAFRKTREKLGLDPVIVHATYLISLFSRKLELREQSAWMLAQEMARADALGADYVVLHMGQVAGEEDLCGANGFSPGSLSGICEALKAATRPGGRKKFRTGLLLENTAAKMLKDGAPSSIAALALLARECGAAGVCIDTCHGFASGCDIGKPGGAEVLADEIRGELGAGKIKLIHLNDSKGPLGSGLDRHEHLGKGKIGAGGLANFLSSPALAGVPVILETPKDNEKSDEENLAVARALIGEK